MKLLKDTILNVGWIALGSGLTACGGGSSVSGSELPGSGVIAITQVVPTAAMPVEPMATTPANPSATPTTTVPVVPTATMPISPTTTTPVDPTVTATSWTPRVADTWQWQLQGTINTSYAVTMYDVDLFVTPQATINLLKSQGKRVVCYFSAGSYESFRPDAADFAAGDKGTSLDPPFADELWLDTRSANVRKIMKTRLDLAVAKKCDGVEPDNMDAYTNSPGFPLGTATQIDYNKFIAQEAKARGLKVGLKNDVDQLAELEPYFDFAVNEQCHQYNECGGYSVFTSKNKPVFNAEYRDDYQTNAAARQTLCTAARASKLRTLVLPILLDNTLRFSCD